MLGILEGAVTASKREFDDLLTSFPNGLDDLYKKILSSSPDIKRAKKILHVVVAAARPLTLDEMNVSLAIEPHHKSVRDLDQDLLPPAGTENILKEICGLFIRVRDSRIYLVHKTAKEFLTRDPKTNHGSPSPGTWKQALDPVESNRIVLNNCFHYLFFADFETNPLPICTTCPELKSAAGTYVSEYKFLRYAAENWIGHFRKAQTKQGDKLLEGALKVCNTKSPAFMTWFQIYWEKNNSHSCMAEFKVPLGLTDLMVVSHLGLVAAMKLLLERGVDVNERVPKYGGALNIAAVGKQRRAIRLLLESGGKFLAAEGEYAELHKVSILLHHFLVGLELRLTTVAWHRRKQANNL